MSRTRRRVSLLIAAHLCAMVLGAVPDPAKLPKLDRPRDTQRNPLSRSITPALDRLAASVAVVHGWTWSGLRPAISLASRYLSTLGLAQSWAMFSLPSRADTYIRIRYYISDASGGPVTWTATELVMPAFREDRMRLLESYRASFRDKAFETALSSFREHRKSIRPETRSTDLPDDVRPITRYFARRFAAGHLLPSERIVRVELWEGAAPSPSPGSDDIAATPESRLDILRESYAGPIEDRTPNPLLPPYHGVQHEADITWTLEYFE